MIESINHTLCGIALEGVPALFKSLNSIINRVALNILMQAAICLLFYLHPNLFALGFAIGFIFDQQVQQVVKKVNIVYSAHQTTLEKLFFFVKGGFLAVLDMPAAIVAATLYYSAQWGASLYQTSLARYLQIDPSQQQILLP